MVVDRIDELEEFYDENRNELSFYGADENPETLMEYQEMVREVVSEIAEEYGLDSPEKYSGKAGEMLAGRVKEELDAPMGNPGEGHEEPDFNTARSLLGE